jgi:hypothetical protein
MAANAAPAVTLQGNNMQTEITVNGRIELNTMAERIESILGAVASGCATLVWVETPKGKEIVVLKFNEPEGGNCEVLPEDAKVMVDEGLIEKRSLD